MHYIRNVVVEQIVLENLKEVIRYVSAVSYTHLDVYKRQTYTINYILECRRYGSTWNKNGLGTNDRTYSLNISSRNDTWNYVDYFILVN